MPVVCYPLTAIDNPNSLNISQDEFTTFAFPDVFTPKCDKHLLSLYNITPESHIKVSRIKEMIASERNS